jgi:peptide/nickel transport system ATP-binding protein
MRPLLNVRDLRVDFPGGREQVVKGISFTLNRGECLALIGESGCGKSVTLRTLVGLPGTGGVVRAEALEFDGADTRRFSTAQWRDIRGGRIGFVLQDALLSLDPLRKVGEEIAEPLRLHRAITRPEREARVLQLLRAVGVPEPELRAAQYPAQLSGGLRQRALIASAIACQPELLIADEPTTALDALVQMQVLDLLASLRQGNTAMLIVSHDLAVAARLADRVAVMRAGEIVETGPTQEILRRPQHQYTRELLAAAAAVHAHDSAPSVPAARRSTPVEVAAIGVTKSFASPGGGKRLALAPSSVTLRAGRTLGIVGGSGSGKTTLTRIILGLEKADSGEVQFQGRPWLALSPAERRAARRRVQPVFQDPLSSFDPRYTVEAVLGEALDVAGYKHGPDRRARALELLRLVRLDGSHLPRRPIELSGGQRQRVAIARALAAEPAVLICDEPVSALDIPVQAQILTLLAELKSDLNLACLFISHDLGVIRRVSDDIAVIKDGHIVEMGEASDIFRAPRHPYTQTLLAAIPDVEFHTDAVSFSMENNCHQEAGHGMFFVN